MTKWNAGGGPDNWGSGKEGHGNGRMVEQVGRGGRRETYRKREISHEPKYLNERFKKKGKKLQVHAIHVCTYCK